MTAIPFIALLLGLAFLPKKFEILLCVFCSLFAAFSLPVSETKSMLAHEYIPFMNITATLYILSHAININLKAQSTTLNICIFLAVASICGSILGTLTTSLILLPPLISILEQRKHYKHIFIFFIMIAGNCGGLLTPLGDPPLLAGYLRGVPFFWTFKNLWREYIFLNLSLILLFALCDRTFFNEKILPKKNHIAIQGYVWIMALFFVLLSQNIIFQAFIMSCMAYWHFEKVRWKPLLELSLLFFALFVTLLPLDWASHITNTPNPLKIFWLSTGLSAFFDNTPAYLLFFEKAFHNPLFLKAISLGSVCGGALTYIGNTPNIIVKKMTENENIQTPSFFEYSFFSGLCLIPLLVGLSYLITFKGAF